MGLPNRWCEVNLFDITTPKQWKTISIKNLTDDGYVVYGANGEIGFYTIFTHEKPTVMIGCRGSCGNIHISKPFSYINGNAMALDSLNENINLKYLYYFLRSRNFNDVISGTAQPQITQEGMKVIDVPLPPLNEQKRIAKKLDELLATVESIKARLDNAPTIIKRFRQSILAAATSGKLTEEWRGENGIVDEWKEDSLNNIASYVVDCPHSTPKWSESGKYCVRTTAFNPFFLDLSKQGFVSENVYQERIQRLKPEEGDILYSREGAILGIACQIPEGVELCLGQRMVLIRASEKALAKYLTIILNSEKVLSIVRTKIIGNAAPRVNMKEIRSYQIPVPSLLEQKEIVSQVESLFTLADTLEEKIEAAKKRVDKLTQSILAKAFRGELVEQDSDDESAEKLLERIRAEQEKEKPKKTRKKK